MELIGCEDETQTPTPDSPAIKPYKVIGVDVRLAAQIVAATPDGKVVLTQQSPRRIFTLQKKLKSLQRKLSRQQQGSNRYENTLRRIRAIHA